MNNNSNHFSEDHFDQHIRQAIDNQYYEPDMAGFNTLAQKYDDHLVKEKIQHFQSPFQHNSWAAIQQRLVAYQNFKDTHFKARLFELLSLFLILFSAYWYMPIENQIPHTDQKQLQELAIQDGTSSVLNTKNSELSAATNNQEKNIVINLNANHSSNEIKESQNSSTSKNLMSNRELKESMQRPILNPIEPAFSFEIAEIDPSLLSSTSNLKMGSFHDDEPINQQEGVMFQEHQLGQVQEIPAIHMTAPVSFTMPTDLMEVVLGAHVIKPDLKLWFWFDIGFNIDRDLVKSPYPTQLSEQQLGRISGNYGFRTGMVFRWKFIDMHVGIRYNRKDYESVYGGNNQVRVLSVPLTARAKLKQNGRFQGYLLGGVVGNYAIHANYSEFKLFEERPELRLTENNRKVSDASWLSHNSYENGILEGETLKGNQYYTLNFGLGMEYQIAPRMKIYLEQTYDHHFGSSSVGPGFDRFYTTSAAIGLRYAILNN
jgi:hypothetical protein